MADPLQYDYRRYLQAKRSVDDRSINRYVLDSLRAQLAGRSGLRVLEIGGGTGTMVRRALDWQLLPAANYTLVDCDQVSLASLAPQLKADAAAAGYELSLVKADITDFLTQNEEPYDLVIANAVLDLLDVPALLTSLARHTRDDALLWFTINFDGESCFLPARPGDDAIWQAYHESMNRRPGRRHAGRALLQTLVEQDAPLLSTGSSDWIVHSSGQRYAFDESYFLHHIVYTIDNELRAAPPLSAAEFAQWITLRHQDIENGQLMYMAHQIDVLAKAPGPGHEVV